MDAQTKKIARGVGILVGTLGIIYLASKVMKPKTPIQIVAKKGVKPFKTESGQEGYVLGDYQFYSNDRVMEKSTKRMGSFDRKDISWDDGKEQKLSEILK